MTSIEEVAAWLTESRSTVGLTGVEAIERSVRR